MSAFWETKPLEEMTAEEWESLCDRCGRCCLLKLEDEDSGELFYTAAVCRYLDTESCRCTVYAERNREVPDCVHVTPENVRTLHWMPRSCAYRALAEGRRLAPWHPLITGDPGSVHEAGASVRSFAFSETDLEDPEALEDHILPKIF